MMAAAIRLSQEAGHRAALRLPGCLGLGRRTGCATVKVTAAAGPGGEPETQAPSQTLTRNLSSGSEPEARGYRRPR
jgi:hypothetical protein